MTPKSKNSKMFAAAAMAVVLFGGCASKTPLTGAEALQALADAQKPCDFPVNLTVSGGSGFSCMNGMNGSEGYTLKFFDAKDDFDLAMASLCELPLGPEAEAKQSDFVLLGENWLATASKESNMSLRDLQPILGGSVESAEKACK